MMKGCTSVLCGLLVLLLIDHGCTQISSLFQCQPSTDQSGLVYTPNIPDFYFNDVNAADFRSGGGANLTTSSNRVTYIFTIPAESSERNCTGNVVAIQYCYETRIDQIGSNEINVFNFLHMNRSGLLFTFTGSFTEQTSPQSRFCTNPMGIIQQVCCETATLDMMDQFQLPTTSYTFAVMIINNDARPLAFAASVDEYRHEQLQTDLGSSAPPPGNNITLGQNTVVPDQSLLLLRFILEPNPLVTTPLVTTPPVTTPVVTTPPDTTPLDTTPPDTTPLDTTLSDTNPLDTTSPDTTPPGNNPQDTTKSDTTLDVSSSSTTLIGGTVGGIIVIALLVVIAVVFLVMWLTRRRRNYELSGNEKGLALSNAVYGASGAGDPRSSQRAPDYAGVGPGSYSEVEMIPLPNNPMLNKEYAEVGASSAGAVNASHDSEEIYLEPVKNVVGLYSQLNQIRAKTLSRDAIGLCEQLGSGQFGVVYKGVWISPDGDVDVAVKTLKEGSGEEDRVKFLQEATIMGQFKHHNVVEMYGVVTEGEPVLITLELLPKGDLKSHLMRLRSEGVDDHTLLSYCRQVASGMAYLSNKAFVHRDLAARNVLVSDDDICKIADFGMSRDLADENYYVSHGGMIPVKWTAPEAIHFKKYSTASDVWSYGALVYEIWSLGYKPFENVTNVQALQMIDTGYRLPPPPGCPRAIYAIMISCWNPDIAARPSFSELTRQLSLPDTKLLKWSEVDKSVHPEAAQLGADLASASVLYVDLQAKYKPKSSGTDYEEI